MLEVEQKSKDQQSHLRVILCKPWMPIHCWNSSVRTKVVGRHSISMAKNITFIMSHVTRTNGNCWASSDLRSHCYITRPEKYGSTGWDGGNPAMWQVDRLTSCAPVEFLPIAVPRSGSSKSRKTPSPPCYLISATSHTGTLCTLCSSAAKYKTTGRDAVYIIRDSCFFFSVWNLG